MPRMLPVACLIGAGSSGIAVAKALHEAGLPFDCFEKSDRIGGNWVFGNANGMSSAYRGLYINTSRDRMQYSDFPMPRSYPDFPHHTQIAAYFESYVDHFGFRDRIRFNTGVAHAELDARGAWRVRLESGETKTYDALFVANGHHWDPAWPEPRFPGRFDVLRGKRVLVLGMGNSAMDIACESSDVAERTFLAARRGAHVIPKYLFGRPLDQIVTSSRMPMFVRKAIGVSIYRLAVGDMTRYGLPKPDHDLGEAHPTISGRILDRLTHGAITPKPNIQELRGDRVLFTDGTEERVDLIVYCTGYKVSFPFFDPKLVSAKDNDLPLFMRCFHPVYKNLLFFGLLQPLGAIMPLAEAQGVWAAKYLRGQYTLPSDAEIASRMEKEREAMFARYVRSRRHTMQVDFDDYLADLRREVRAGEKRARRSRASFPIATARPPT
jgi:hypothetical protein